jgi:hypothetical protein
MSTFQVVNEMFVLIAASLLVPWCKKYCFLDLARYLTPFIWRCRGFIAP